MADSHDIGTSEVWKPIPGFEGSFEASSLGRVKALRRQAGTRWYAERIMTPIPVIGGYLKVNLSYAGNVYQRKIHQLVLETFVGPCPDRLECLHDDGNPTNNQIENLAWGTRKENATDRRRHGRDTQGERHGRAKLTEVAVREIRRLRTQGASGTKLAELFKVSRTTLYYVLQRRSWRHVA